MTVHGYELLEDWRISTSGKIAKAKKGGKTYFLKKYQTPVAPINNGALDAKTFAHNKKEFDDFVDRRTRINIAIRSLAGEGGNIIIPIEEFIDGNQFVEASEFVEGVVGDEELETVLASLSTDVKKLLMQTAAGALYSVHSKHIVHSDLKPKNVLLVRNKAGNYVAKLVDFDSSYFVDKKPPELIGTNDYYSPELGLCKSVEDDREELERKLTEKSDIFSLGLIFHFYLAGELPKATSLTEKLRKRQEKGKVIYCWVALNNGCELKLSPAITDPLYISLISDMLKLEPEERPSASEVLKRLRGPAAPVRRGLGRAEPVISVIEEPWPEHRIMLNRDKLRADGIVGLKKLPAAGLKKYELTSKSGKKTVLSPDELLSAGYCTAIRPDGFCEPWEEHNIVFIEDRLRSRGFVSGERTVANGVKGYIFYRADSIPSFIRKETMIALQYAKGKPRTAAPGGIAEPWPEHRIVFDEAVIRSKGFVSVDRQLLGGIKGYRFTRSDGNPQFMRVEIVLIQKLARKL